jgi:hypothetical protein
MSETYEEAPGETKTQRVIREAVEREVDRALKAQAAAFEARMAEMLASVQPQSISGFGDKASLEMLALAISDASDEKRGRERISPEEQAKRIRAREGMERLITETFEAGVQPTYNLTQKFYIGERIVEPYWLDRATKTTKPTEIGWWGIPDEFMVPTNAQAEAIHKLFLESVGGRKRRGKTYRVTPGGLTVRSGGMNPDGGRDQAPKVGRDMAEPAIKGRGAEQTYVEQRILGTLMPPARQMV